ncbi:MAG: aminotransferase class I/II-fold pyridoxal phosphate-dependent enzyme [Candidatus Aminicenantes bacterium]|nr:aminotransferase class I/II-fold pyridoxal phosphate-dependent enzyme [Candidatus Aminicenantes bacterium]
MKDLFEKCSGDSGYFGPFRVRGDHYFSRPVLEPIPGHEMIFHGRKVIQWSINNYLGLAENEEIKALAVEAAQKYGASSPMGARMMTGNTEYHIALEKKFADWLRKEDAVLFNYGYLGVIGTIASLVDATDTIIVDKLSHASMLDGIFVSQAKFRVYRHNDMNSLESHLKHVNKDRKGGVMIVTEGVFGMRGDIADLPAICALKDKYDARIYVDDAHGFGVMGEGGRGSGEYFGVHDKLDIYFGTFAKAFAAIGGVTATTKPVAEWIRYNARTQIFAKSLPMIYVQVLSKTLDIIANDQARRKKMWENAAKIKAGIRDLGYEVGEVPSPLCAVYVPAGDVPLGMAIIKSLRDMGIFVTGVIYPVVPKGILLFRMVPTASHTDEDIQRTVAAFKKVRDDLKLDLNATKTMMSQETGD